MISLLDIIILGVLVLFTFHGYSKGLGSRLISLAALLAATIISLKYSRTIGMTIQSVLETGAVASGIIGIILVFVVLLLAAYIIKKIFNKIPIIKFWDKLGGVIFGAVEGAVLLSFVFMFLAIFHLPHPGSTLQKSYLYKPIKGFDYMISKPLFVGTPAEKTLDEISGFCRQATSYSDSTTKKLFDKMTGKDTPTLSANDSSTRKYIDHFFGPSGK